MQVVVFVIVVLVLALFYGCVKGCAEKDLQADERRIAAAEKARYEVEVADKNRKEAELAQQLLVEQAEQAERERNAAFKSTIESFVKDKAPALFKAYDDAVFRQQDFSNKLVDLRETLIRLNQNPDKDKDFLAYLNAHSDLVDTERLLKDRMDELFLSYKKFQYRPDDKASKDEFEAKIEEGLLAAKKAEERYHELCRDMEK